MKKKGAAKMGSLTTTHGDAAASDALVLFGVTGDLAYKKIFPALYAVVKRGSLDVPVIGVASSRWSLAQLLDRITEAVSESGGIDDQNAFEHLLSLFRYVPGDYNNSDTFNALKQMLGDARRPAHYLAIPPSLFATVIKNLGAAGLADNAAAISAAGITHSGDLTSAKTAGHAAAASKETWIRNHSLVTAGGRRSHRNVLFDAPSNANSHPAPRPARHP